MIYWCVLRPGLNGGWTATAPDLPGFELKMPDAVELEAALPEALERHIDSFKLSRFRRPPAEARAVPVKIELTRRGREARRGEPPISAAELREALSHLDALLEGRAPLPTELIRGIFRAARDVQDELCAIEPEDTGSGVTPVASMSMGPQEDEAPAGDRRLKLVSLERAGKAARGVSGPKDDEP